MSAAAQQPPPHLGILLSHFLWGLALRHRGCDVARDFIIASSVQNAAADCECLGLYLLDKYPHAVVRCGHGAAHKRHAIESKSSYG